MKVPVLFLLLALSSLTCFSQQECQDVIFTADGDRIIFNCCIQAVKNKNLVIYKKDGVTSSVKANAITRDGEYFELQEPTEQVPLQKSPVVDGKYDGRAYQYYEDRFYGARTRQFFGIASCIAGVGFWTASMVIASQDYVSSQDMDRAVGYFLLGGLLVNVGVPLWISGGIKKVNNRRAMEAFKQPRKFSLGVTRDGIGVVCRF